MVWVTGEALGPGEKVDHAWRAHVVKSLSHTGRQVHCSMPIAAASPGGHQFEVIEY